MQRLVPLLLAVLFPILGVLLSGSTVLQPLVGQVCEGPVGLGCRPNTGDDLFGLDLPVRQGLLCACVRSETLTATPAFGVLPADPPPTLLFHWLRHVASLPVLDRDIRCPDRYTLPGKEGSEAWGKGTLQAGLFPRDRAHLRRCPCPLFARHNDKEDQPKRLIPNVGAVAGTGFEPVTFGL